MKQWAPIHSKKYPIMLLQKLLESMLTAVFFLKIVIKLNALKKFLELLFRLIEKITLTNKKIVIRYVIIIENFFIDEHI